MTRYGLDYVSLTPQEAKAQGASFVCRYLSPDTAKNLSHSEAEELKSLGIDVVVVFESTARRSLDGSGAGQADATMALTQAIECGMVGARPIYFAIDFDASPDPNGVNDYFDGVKEVLGLGRTGAYGGSTAISHLFDTTRISWGWQTYAWSGGAWDPRAHLRQYLNGAQYDHDLSTAADFGQWQPGVGPPHPIAPHQYAALLPKERVAVDKYLELKDTHPHWHPHQLEAAEKAVAYLRMNVWTCAEKGHTLTGQKVTPGWKVLDRKERYEILKSVVPYE